MERASYHKEGFSFRFIQLPSGTASRVRSSISNVELKSRRPDVIFFELAEEMDLEPLYSFLDREALDPKTYSVWVSVISSSDRDGVSIPTFVLDLIRRTKCGIDFSFVAALGSDDES